MTDLHSSRHGGQSVGYLPKLARAKARVPFGNWTGLTRREGEAAFFIGWHVATKGYGPAYADIAAHLGIKSKSQVCNIVAALKAKGMINHLYYRTGAIELTHPITPLTDEFPTPSASAAPFQP